MNNVNERQHHVSKVLLKPFKLPDQPLQCYQVKTEVWEAKSIERTCSASGYNQLLISGDADNVLEADFSKVESRFPRTFKALAKAAKTPQAEFSLETYANLCQYCTFLKLSSLFSKASAVVSFVEQVNMELKMGQYTLLRELAIPQDTVTALRKGRLQGGKVIVEGQNVLQYVYRIQFAQLFKYNYAEFFHCHWKIFNSPIEFPLSDIGIVPLHITEPRGNLHILPIGPKLILRGLFPYEVSERSTHQCVKSMNLPAEETEYLFDLVCSSAVSEIVCSRINQDVLASLKRAKTGPFRFHRIVNPDLVKSAGLMDSSGEYNFRVVSVAEHTRFVHTYILPPQNEEH